MIFDKYPYNKVDEQLAESIEILDMKAEDS